MLLKLWWMDGRLCCFISAGGACCWYSHHGPQRRRCRPRLRSGDEVWPHEAAAGRHRGRPTQFSPGECPFIITFSPIDAPHQWLSDRKIWLWVAVILINCHLPDPRLLWQEDNLRYRNVRLQEKAPKVAWGQYWTPEFELVSTRCELPVWIIQRQPLLLTIFAVA